MTTPAGAVVTFVEPWFRDSIETLKISPYTEEGTPIVKVCEGAFEGCVKLKSVQIPETMKIIGNNAFMNCSRLSTITIPADAVVAPDAFEGCSRDLKIIRSHPTDAGSSAQADADES